MAYKVLPQDTNAWIDHAITYERQGLSSIEAMIAIIAQSVLNLKAPCRFDVLLIDFDLEAMFRRG